MDVRDVISNHKIDSYEQDWDDSNLNMQQPDGDALIHWVARYGTVEEAECLLAAGANPEIRGDIGRTALSESVVFKNIDVACCLISKGANLLAEDDYGDSILELAHDAENKEILKLVQDHINNVKKMRRCTR